MPHGYGEDETGESAYMNPCIGTERVTCKALYDYHSSLVDELSFAKHAIITNVVKRVMPMWYRGDYGGKVCCYFPANYVMEIGPNGEEVVDTPVDSDPPVPDSLRHAGESNDGCVGFCLFEKQTGTLNLKLY